MVNRINNFFLKGGHSAIQTKLNSFTHKECETVHKLTPKQTHQNYRLGTLRNDVLRGGGGGGGGFNLALASEMVQNI